MFGYEVLEWLGSWFVLYIVVVVVAFTDIRAIYRCTRGNERIVMQEWLYQPNLSSSFDPTLSFF